MWGTTIKILGTIKTCYFSLDFDTVRNYPPKRDVMLRISLKLICKISKFSQINCSNGVDYVLEIS